MIIAANVAFAIAAVFLGQLFVLRRRAAPTVAVLRFAPNFDAAADGALRAAEASASSATTADATSSSTTSTRRDEPEAAGYSRKSDDDRTDAAHERVNAGGPEPHTYIWPWERKARAIIDPAGHLASVPDPLRPVADESESEQVPAAEAPPSPPVPYIEAEAAPANDAIVAADATHEFALLEVAALELETTTATLSVDHVGADRYDDVDEAGLIDIPPVAASPWWRRVLPHRRAKVDTGPLAVRGLHLDDDESYAVVVPRDEEQHRSSTSVPVNAAPADVVDDDVPVLSDSLGLTPERRAELAAQHQLAAGAGDAAPGADTSDALPIVSAAETVEPVTSTAASASPAPVPASELTVSAADAARALAQAQMRASAWACEAANTLQPFTVEKRRRLLEYYAATITEPASREIVARVEREDPDLASLAAEILRQAAA